MLPWHEDIAEQYKYSAMATGAFPIGLKPVRVSRNPEMLKKLSWFSHLVKEDFDKPESLTSLIVDGGMINNEPFERVRSELDLITGVFALEKEEQAKENQDYGKFRSTVLMVDPFPSVSSQTHLGSDILGYGANLLSALVNQARIKPVHLEEAMASNCAGQYLISPTRYHYTSEGWQKIEGSKAIACGSLEGFGGFLSKEFRVHDFFLGRANCEKFLRDHFTVPKEKENPIFVKGYEKIQDPDLLQFTSVTDKGLQIIPIFTESRPQPYQPEFKTGNWPKVPQSVLMSYRPQVKNRVDGLIANLVPLSGRDKWLLWAARKAFLSPKLTDAVMKTCEQSLKDHCQLL